MSRFAAGRAVYRWGRRAKCNVRMVDSGSPEARDIERDYVIPEKGFCHECETFVDEPNGKLHRPTCKTTPGRRRAS